MERLCGEGAGLTQLRSDVTQLNASSRNLEAELRNLSRMAGPPGTSGATGELQTGNRKWRGPGVALLTLTLRPQVSLDPRGTRVPKEKQVSQRGRGLGLQMCNPAPSPVSLLTSC